MELMVIGLAGYTPEYFHVRIYKLTAPPPRQSNSIFTRKTVWGGTEYKKIKISYLGRCEC